MKALLALLVLLLAGCSPVDTADDYSGGGQEVQANEEAPPKDAAPKLALGEGAEIVGDNGGKTVRGTVTVTGYSWNAGPVEAYGQQEAGPFLVVNAEWKTEQVYFFDSHWLVFDDGGESQYSQPLGGALGEDVPEDGGDGVVVFPVREQKAGTLWLQDHYGQNLAGWEITA